MSPYNTQKKKISQQFWKKPGETLAVMLRRFRDEENLGPEVKLTYAGRLDPMAEGIVPILVGEMRFQKDMLQNRAKTYEVQILLGIATDTGDMLGLALPNQALNIVKGISARSDRAAIENSIKNISEISALPYPMYSSRPVDGKPLFMHARSGNAVQVPIKDITIHSLELLDSKEVVLKELLEDAVSTISLVQGDFRQAEIIEQWNNLKKINGDTFVQVITIRATVSSGTYMRSLAEKLGELLGVPALAYKIIRTGIEGIT
jgi:tRNA pseudouridine(55) synthase